MKPTDIARVQRYLRQAFDNNRIKLVGPSKPDGPTEMYLGDEFVGALYRDDDEGEISYSLNITILDEDLPPPGLDPV